MARSMSAVALSLLCTVPAAAVRISLPGLTGRGLDASSHIGAAVCAGAELMEDFEAIGHGHGMLLLVGSKFCREAYVLRESAAETAEDLGEGAVSVIRLVGGLWRLLTSRLVSSILAIGALLTERSHM